MAEYELGNKLKEIYEGAPKGEITVQLILFGIQYADEIRDNNFRISEILKVAGLTNNRSVEINNGIKLSKHVNIKRVQ